MSKSAAGKVCFPHRHLLGIEGLTSDVISLILDCAENFVEHNRQVDNNLPSLKGRTLVNLFFEDSTRTRTSFELAAKQLGANMLNDISSLTYDKEMRKLVIPQNVPICVMHSKGVPKSMKSEAVYDNVCSMYMIFLKMLWKTVFR